MKVLVTGGAGYIGSQMVRQLLEKKHEAVVFDNMSGGHRASLPQTIPLVIGDVNDQKALENVFAHHTFDAVMHFAGVISMGESMQNPEKYFTTNTFGALHLVELMVKHKVLKLIFSSTAGVYGNPVQLPIKESDPKSPTNPYGQSKLMFEEILRWYDKIHNLRSISLRYFNAAGGSMHGQYGEDHAPETHIIPTAIKAALTNSPFSIFGTDYKTKDGTAVRDYVYIIDLCDAHLLALDALIEGHETDAYNIGPGIGHSNKDVVEMVKAVTGVDFPIIHGYRRVGDADELVADGTKIRETLQWSPKYTDIRTIIETAWKWHKTHPNGYQA